MAYFQQRTNRRRPANHVRGGAAAVELAILLPLLMSVLVITVDFARVFYFSQVLENCARNGALYGSNLTKVQSPYASVTQAALADATDLSPQPTVTSTTGTDAAGNPYVRVQVDYQVPMVTSFLGFSHMNLSRTVQMRVAPN